MLSVIDCMLTALSWGTSTPTNTTMCKHKREHFISVQVTSKVYITRPIKQGAQQNLIKALHSLFLKLHLIVYFSIHIMTNS